MSVLIRQLDERIEEIKGGINAQSVQLANYLELREIEARKIGLSQKLWYSDMDMIQAPETDKSPRFDWKGNSKVDCIMQLVRLAGARGIERREVRGLLQKRNVKASANIGYVTLRSLKEQGKVREVTAGRYVAA